MSFDVVLLGADGRPEKTVPIGVDVHARLMDLASRQKLSLLQRMSDYYEDAKYSVAELQSLADEVNRVGTATGDDVELSAVAKGLLDLIADAKARSRGLEALAD
jgi:hypothetical protein